MSLRENRTLKELGPSQPYLDKEAQLRKKYSEECKAAGIETRREEATRNRLQNNQRRAHPTPQH